MEWKHIKPPPFRLRDKILLWGFIGVFTLVMSFIIATAIIALAGIRLRDIA